MKYVALILCLLIPVLWLLARFLRGMKREVIRLKQIEIEIAAEQERISKLDMSTAEQLGLTLLRNKAILTPWESEIPQSLESVLKDLHPSLRSLFHTYRCWKFEGETGTRFDAKYLLEKQEIPGMFLVSIDDFGHKLWVKRDSPIIFETNEGDIIGQYPSIFHYFLLAEAE